MFAKIADYWTTRLRFRGRLHTSIALVRITQVAVAAASKLLTGIGLSNGWDNL